MNWIRRIFYRKYTRCKYCGKKVHVGIAYWVYHYANDCDYSIKSPDM